MIKSGDQQRVGEIISVECKDGPVSTRTCTDVICFLIFFIVFVALFGVAIYGFTQGNPTLLYTPMDPDGTFCGYTSNATDYPYIYFVAPSTTTLFRTTCVKSCPTSSSTELECLTNSMVHECTGTVISDSSSTTTSDNSTTSTTTDSSTNSSSDSTTNDTTTDTTATDTTTTDTTTTDTTTNDTTTTTTSVRHSVLTTKNPAFYVKDIFIQQNNGKKKAVTLHHLTSSYNYSEVVMIYPSVAFSTVCLPQLQTFLTNVMSAINLDGLVEALEDLELTWAISLACCGIAVAIGFIFLILTRYCAKIIVWLFILLFLVVLLALGAIYVLKAQGYTIDTSGNWASVDSVLTQAQSTTSGTTTYWIIGIVCLVLAGILLILISCFFSRIRLATAIIESAALFVAENPTSLFVPIFNFLTVVVWLTFWIIGLLWVISMGDLTNNINHFPYGNFQLTSSGEWLAVFFCVGCLWVFAFILHMANFIFGLSTSIWYFERMQKITAHPILQSTKWFFRYHVGSVALGSGIITLIWLIQMILSLIAKQQKKAGNKCGEYCIKCIACLVSCFERFIAYLSKNAYTYIGMTSKNFCSSAWEVFQMIIRNPLRFSVTGFLGEVFQLFGEGFICVLTAFCGYEIITNVDYYSTSLNSTFWPTVVFGFIGFVIGSLFMTVYGAVADAILIVFVLDEEIHKNHLGKAGPEQIPAPLQEFVKQAEEHNQVFSGNDK